MADFGGISGGGGAFGGAGGGGGLNLQALLSMLSQGMGQYQQFIQNPTRSPLYKKQLSGILGALRPGEEQQQQDLGDVFRGAGNMSSSLYGGAQSNLIGQQGLNRQTLASQLLGTMFPQMTQALMQPMNLYTQLLQALSQGGGGGQGGGQSGLLGETPGFGDPGFDPWGISTGPYPSTSRR